MRLSFVSVIVATFCTNCIAAEPNSVTAPKTPLDVIHSPDEHHYPGKRILRTSAAVNTESDDEERGFFSFLRGPSKLAPGAEKMDAKALKIAKKHWVKNAGLYDDLRFGNADKTNTFSTWHVLGYSPNQIAKGIHKVVDRPLEYQHIADEYAVFLARFGNIRLQ